MKKYTRQPHFCTMLWYTSLATVVQAKHSKSHKIFTT